MTKAELIAALAQVADAAEIVLDVGIDTFLDIRVEVDEGSGVRVLPAEDEEEQEFVEAVREALA